MSKTNPAPLVLSKGTPHKSAKKFRELFRPTLINMGDEWMDYDSAGFYYLIADKDIDKEVSEYLIDAQVRVETQDGDNNRKTTLNPFNPKRSDIAEVYEALKRHCHKPGVKYDRFWLDGREGPDPDNIISCLNGLLDINDGVLHAHDSAFFTRSALPINYDYDAAIDPASAQPEEFLKWIDEVMQGDKESIYLVQEMLGYLVSTDTNQEAVFFLVGESRGGKGTLIKFIEGLVGENNISTPTIAALSERFWAAELKDKSVATVTDMAVSDPRAIQMAANHINIVSGRDRVNIDRKNKDVLTGVRLPTCIVMASNSIPNFGEHAKAFANRLRLVFFGVTFLGREDTNLAKRILTNELEPLFLWALDGLRRLRANGRFTEPRKSREKKEKLLAMANPLRTFLDLYCVEEAGAEVLESDFYDAYTTYCQTTGVKSILALKDLTIKLDIEANITVTRPRIDGVQRRHFHGVRLANRESLVPFDFLTVLEDWLACDFEAADAIEVTRAAAKARE